jgi:hypothetical protein
MSTTLNLSSIELVSTERRGPKNGAPSSQDFNDGQRETLVDLSSIANVLNNVILPLLSSLPETTPLVLDGDGIYASHQNSDIFVDSTDHSQLTISDVLTRVNATVISLSSAVDDLSAKVLQLQTRLATTNQNDVAKAIQGFAETLAVVTQRVAALEARP